MIKKERPIPFSGPMVRAISEGRKTQTRRAFDERTMNLMKAAAAAGEVSWFMNEGLLADNDLSYIKQFCPYGRPSDLLWVREAWRTVSDLDALSGKEIEAKCIEAGYRKPWAPIRYEIDGELRNWEHISTPPHGDAPQRGRYRHGRFMPRWASRIVLEITAVRVERLQDISEADALAEGIESLTGDKTIYHWDFPKPRPPYAVSGYKSARDAYKELWVEINGRESLDANPWVWVIEFKRVTR